MIIIIKNNYGCIVISGDTKLHKRRDHITRYLLLLDPGLFTPSSWNSVCIHQWWRLLGAGKSCVPRKNSELFSVTFACANTRRTKPNSLHVYLLLALSVAIIKNWCNSLFFFWPPILTVTPLHIQWQNVGVTVLFDPVYFLPLSFLPIADVRSRSDRFLWPYILVLGRVGGNSSRNSVGDIWGWHRVTQYKLKFSQNK